MLVTAAKLETERLLKLHNLTDWKLVIDKAVRRFGQCNHTTKTIKLSRALILINEEAEVIDTILHEIAHALVGAGHGHDKVWKAKAKEIGARPTTYYGHEVVTPEPKYVGVCPNDCGKKLYRHRRRVLACGKCCKGTFNPKYLFIWKLNKNQ